MLIIIPALEQRDFYREMRARYSRNIGLTMKETIEVKSAPGIKRK